MADEHANYLSRIQFDEKLKDSWYAKYLLNFRLVLLLIIAIILVGLINFFDIPRRLNPAVDIPIVTISTVLPGATPEDIEALVTIPIEDKLKAIENVDTLTSTSRDNVSVIVMQFVSTVNTDDALNDVQKAVDTVTDLPEDAKTPSVNTVDFENQPVWIFSLVSTDTPSLMRAADNLEKELEDVKSIDHVDTSGTEQQKIYVTVDPTKITEYGISPITLSQAISQSVSSFPAGNIQDTKSTFSLVIDPAINTLEDIRNIRIKTGEKVVSLGQIATVSESSEFDQNKTLYGDAKTTSQRAVQFFVYKTSSANIDASAKDAEKVVDTFLKQYHNQFKLVSVTNTGELIVDQFTDLVGEFKTTVLLIFLILFVFLGLRQAVIASFTVPLTFLAAIAIANYMGLTLNFLTLFAFLIALGLLIDDTIVIVTAMTRYHASGKFTPAETGILVWKDFIVPIWSTTITTIWSFVPLLLATGIIGEFIKPIPIIVTATMIASTSIAVLITIPLMIVFLNFKAPRRVKILLYTLLVLIIVGTIIYLLPKGSFFVPLLLVTAAIAGVFYYNRKIYTAKLREKMNSPRIKTLREKSTRFVNHGVINIESISLRYMKILHNILISRTARRGVIAFLVIFSVVSYLLVPLGFVKNEFFPKTDEDTLYVSLELPAGTSLNTTITEARVLHEEIRKMDNVRYVVAETGTGLSSDGNRSTDPSLVLYTLNIGKPKERNITSIEIADKLRTHFANYDRGKVAIQELSGGPPAGADIQIKLLGNDLGELDKYADRIQAYLQSQPGATNVNKSIKAGTSKVIFVPDENKMAEQGIDRGTLGLWLRTYASGFTLDSIRFEDEQDVVFRLDTQKATPETISSLSIQTPTGNIPLVALGEFRLGSNPTLITHEDTRRTISVAATVTKGYSLTDINKKLETFANGLDLPTGYSWQTGGVNEENQKSITSILQAMGLSFLLILITMVIEFNSYRQAAIVMLTIPLAVSGVFYIFGLTGTPLSFPALIGVLALFGIVVTNAIVVMEKINSNVREGMELEPAIVDAAGSRLEPVLLTSLATIFGLLPITLADPLWRGLGGAIISGLFFSGVIKLFFIPIMYYNWFHEDKVNKN
ncbi:N/A [soil metagenome]